MNGKPWMELIQAVNALFNKIQSDGWLSQIIKCTIINYNDSARTIFQEQYVSSNLIDKITFNGGNTCFKTVLRSAINLIDNTHDNYDNIRLVLMSDGFANYPKEEIDILNSKNYKNKMNLQTILFGTHADGKKALRSIAKDLGGKYSNAVTLEDLAKNFIEVINIKFNIF